MRDKFTYDDIDAAVQYVKDAEALALQRAIESLIKNNLTISLDGWEFGPDCLRIQIDLYFRDEKIDGDYTDIYYNT